MTDSELPTLTYAEREQLERKALGPEACEKIEMIASWLAQDRIPPGVLLGLWCAVAHEQGLSRERALQLFDRIWSDGLSTRDEHREQVII